MWRPAARRADGCTDAACGRGPISDIPLPSNYAAALASIGARRWFGGTSHEWRSRRRTTGAHADRARSPGRDPVGSPRRASRSSRPRRNPAGSGDRCAPGGARASGRHKYQQCGHRRPPRSRGLHDRQALGLSALPLQSARRRGYGPAPTRCTPEADRSLRMQGRRRDQGRSVSLRDRLLSDQQHGQRHGASARRFGRRGAGNGRDAHRQSRQHRASRRRPSLGWPVDLARRRRQWRDPFRGRAHQRRHAVGGLQAQERRHRRQRRRRDRRRPMGAAPRRN